MLEKFPTSFSIVNNDVYQFLNTQKTSELIWGAQKRGSSIPSDFQNQRKFSTKVFGAKGCDAAIVSQTSEVGIPMSTKSARVNTQKAWAKYELTELFEFDGISYKRYTLTDAPLEFRAVR